MLVYLLYYFFRSLSKGHKSNARFIERVQVFLDGQFRVKDQFTHFIRLRGFMRIFCWGQEKVPLRIVSGLMNQNTEAHLGISEPISKLFAGKPVDEKCSERLVVAMSGICGFEEHIGPICYLF